MRENYKHTSVVRDSLCYYWYRRVGTGVSTPSTIQTHVLPLLLGCAPYRVPSSSTCII